VKKLWHRRPYRTSHVRRDSFWRRRNATLRHFRPSAAAAAEFSHDNFHEGAGIERDIQ
jgi:hypothetical protein